MTAKTNASDTTEALSGTIEHITYSNGNNGYTVATLKLPDDEITIVGIMPFVSVGDFVEITGSFDVHPTYGPQFKVKTFERSAPTDTASILNYLSSGAIRGVGPATARSIIERFGDRALEIIETEPLRLAEIRGISEEKAKSIGESYLKQFGIRDLILFLSPFKVSPERALKVYQALGSNSCEIIKRNPYVLCSEDIGFTFEKAEEIAYTFGYPKDSGERISAGIEYVLKHNLQNGHTCLPKDKLIATASRLLECDPGEAEEICEYMLSSLMLRKIVNGQEEFIALPKYHAAEDFIAARLSVMLKYAPPSEMMAELEIDLLEQRQKIKYEEKQREAIRTALSNGITVLTGGPGTGKTTTLNAIIRILMSKGLTISLAAPTGRAAKRITELTGFEAKTIHRLLEVEWSEDEKQSFARNEQNPLKCDVLIVDEMSMVDALIFESLLRAVRLGCRLILVGDADQLPSVGAGNVLADILASGHIPAVKLDKVFRQAMESLIVANAHRIIAGEMPDLSSKASDFFMLKARESNSACDTVVDLCVNRLPKAYNFDPLTDIQVLCPSKMLDLGSTNLNNMLQNALNPNAKKKNSIFFKGCELREGDKVMQIKNNYDIIWTSDKGEEGTGIFNGDVGILKTVDRHNGIVQVKFDDKLATYYSDNIGELELAYAMTIHKSQGSEFECVVLPLFDTPSRLLYRNLLYTAVTRAKKLLIIVGSERTVETMVENNRKNLRYTCLKRRLNENFTK